LKRTILAQSAAIHDEGTNSMMGDFISEQEKIIWMMQAWLEGL
jgi:starvation-inducible DNA-binding protein